MNHGPEGKTHPHVSPALSVEDGRTILDPEIHRSLVQARDAGKVEGEVNGRKWTTRPAFQPDAPHYPKVETHLWGAWPLLALEIDGYRGVDVRDPYTGRSIYAHDVFEDGRSIYDTLRLVIDAMEAADFLPDAPDN